MTQKLERWYVCFCIHFVCQYIARARHLQKWNDGKQQNLLHHSVVLVLVNRFHRRFFVTTCQDTQRKQYQVLDNIFWGFFESTWRIFTGVPHSFLPVCDFSVYFLQLSRAWRVWVPQGDEKWKEIQLRIAARLHRHCFAFVSVQAADSYQGIEVKAFDLEVRIKSCTSFRYRFVSGVRNIFFQIARWHAQTYEYACHMYTVLHEYVTCNLSDLVKRMGAHLVKCDFILFHPAVLDTVSQSSVGTFVVFTSFE